MVVIYLSFELIKFRVSSRITARAFYILGANTLFFSNIGSFVVFRYPGWWWTKKTKNMSLRKQIM